MSLGATKIMCGQCLTIAEMPENPADDAELRCPVCERSDTMAKATSDARHHATHMAKRALEQKMMDQGRNLNTRTPTRSPNRLRWISNFEA